MSATHSSSSFNLSSSSSLSTSDNADGLAGVKLAWNRLEYTVNNSRRRGSKKVASILGSATATATAVFPPLKLKGLHLDRAAIAALDQKAASCQSITRTLTRISLQECSFEDVATVHDLIHFFQKRLVCDGDGGGLQELTIFDTLSDGIYQLEEPFMETLLEGLAGVNNNGSSNSTGGGIPTLERLVLCCANLSGPATAQALLRLLSNNQQDHPDKNNAKATLVNLGLPYCRLDDHVMEALLEGLNYNNGLQGLDLSRCDMDSLKLQRLVQALTQKKMRNTTACTSSLRALDLSKNVFSQQAFVSLAQLLNHNNNDGGLGQSLEMLRLDGCTFWLSCKSYDDDNKNDQDGMECTFVDEKENPALQLSPFTTFTKALASSSHLKSFYMSRCFIPWPHLEVQLYQALNRNMSLVQMSVSNTTTDNTSRTLQQQLRLHQTAQRNRLLQKVPALVARCNSNPNNPDINDNNNKDGSKVMDRGTFIWCVQQLVANSVSNLNANNGDDNNNKNERDVTAAFAFIKAMAAQVMV